MLYLFSYYLLSRLVSCLSFIYSNPFSASYRGQFKSFIEPSCRLGISAIWYFKVVILLKFFKRKKKLPESEKNLKTVN